MKSLLFNKKLGRAAAILLTICILPQAGAAVTEVPPFTGTNTETWEEFPNYDSGGQYSSLTILGGLATISDSASVMFIYEPSTGATWGLCPLEAEVSDGTKGMGLNSAPDTGTIIFNTPVTDFGAYWGAAEGCGSPTISFVFLDADGNQVGADSFDYVSPDSNGALEWRGYHFSVPVKSLTYSGYYVATDGMQANVASCAPVPPNMIAWWRGDGDANDSIGGHDGSLLAGATFAAGEVGQAFSFDGTSAHVEIPDSPSLNPTNRITIDAWVKTSTNSRQALVSKFNESFSSPSGSYDLAILNDSLLEFRLDNVGYLQVPAAVCDGQWHHVAGTYDGTTMFCYVDGVLAASTSASGGNITTSTLPLYLGAELRDNADSGFLNGELDEVEIFNRALTPDEIARIAAAGPLGKCKCTPPPPDMVSWWPGEGFADDIQDGNNGTVNGATFSPGKVGQAFSFDGAGANVFVPDSPSLDYTDFTYDAWIAPDPSSPANDNYIICKGQVGTYRPLIFMNGTAGAHQWIVFLDGGTLNGGPVTYSYQHIAVTREGSIGKLYVDGVLKDTQTVGTNSAGGFDLEFGNIPGFGSSFFKGSLDEVEIFSRALSIDEIQAIFHAGSAGKCKSCTTYSESFTQGQPASAQASQDWTNFRQALKPSTYDTVTISGTFDTVGRTLTDATIVPQIAAALKNATSGAWPVGNLTWNVGVGCSSGTDVELNARSNSSSQTGWCSCEGAETYTVRPEIANGNPGNDNWGGVNTITCSAPSQTLTVVFSNAGSGKCATPAPAARQFANISSRANVGTGDDVAIGGFIIRGDPVVATRGTRSNALNKQVLIRGIGPSLQVNNTPVAGRLMDPYLELHDGNGALMMFNDDWADTQGPAIQATGLAPSDPKESAILATLNAEQGYTAILSGVGGTTGIGLVEVYDLEFTGNSHLVNISTRGFVSTGDDVLIGGLIVQGGTPAPVLLRAIGPSLSGFNVTDPLDDPVLELHDGNGALIESNDDWGSSPEAAAIFATALNPTDPKESAILFTPAPGAYTAIVSGKNPNPTGVALVEAYRLSSP